MFKPQNATQQSIQRVRVLPCVQQQEDPSWRFAQGTIPQVAGWLIELQTDAGVSAYGYVEVIPVVSCTPAGALAAIQTLAPLLLGRDPFRIESILLEMDGVLGGHRHVKAGFDCALHELNARMVQQPLHCLFGGAVHGRMATTRIVPIKPPHDMAEDAARLAGKGYRYLKIKLSGDAALDIERVRLIRARVGDAVRLSVDPNQAYSAKGAIMTLKQIGRFGVDLVEQPVRATDHVGLKLVRQSVDMVVEADESITSLGALLELIALEALDSANLKIGDLGGLRNTLTAARICEAAGIGYRIGATFGPRLMAAQATHLASVFPRQSYAQEVAEFDHLLDDPFSGLEIGTDGQVAVPDGVGSGVALTGDTGEPAYEITA
nr:enolase C-terminal domain-like protein [uncultured Pseudogulbenkiania sp.]